MREKPKRVLIVEDEKPMAKALELKLTKAGFEVATAFNGEIALALVRKGKFDMIVLDLVMPKIDGFAVLRELRSRKAKIPVMVMSNLGQAEDMTRARDLGAREYFVKSDTTIADVVERVKTALRP